MGLVAILNRRPVGTAVIGRGSLLGSVPSANLALRLGPDGSASGALLPWVAMVSSLRYARSSNNCGVVLLERYSNLSGWFSNRLRVCIICVR